MSAIKNLSIKTNSKSFFDIIDSCKQYFANMIPSKKEHETNIHTIPFYKLKAVTPVEEFSEEIKATFGNMAKRVYLRMLESERGQDILSKAKKYNIPYNKSDISWLRLIDEVDGYEAMLREADESGITWDISEYDPAGLRQALDDNLHLCLKEKREMYWDRY